MINAFDFTIEDMMAYFKSIGEPAFRAKQVFKWLYSGVTCFDDMTNLSKTLREKLETSFYITLPRTERKLVSADGTVKYLFAMHDNICVESVVMKYKHGYTICISTQAGCRMGCRFCASTLHGLDRNLTPGEMAGQLIAAQNDLGVRISNIVMMGSGEPLDNFENVIKFIKNAVNPDGLQIGARHITISTCGLVDRMYDLAEIDIPVNLAVSLHAGNNETRKEIMPVANKYDIESLINACHSFFDKTGRRVTFEYALIKGVNDTPSHARELAALLGRNVGFHVNLIPVNTVAERGYSHGSHNSVIKFAETLKQNGVNTTVRREMGSDINAACGQLRNRERKTERSNL